MLFAKIELLELHLIKTKKFKERNYIGDPLNAAHVFSNFEVDELIVLDIDANKNNRCIPYEFIKALSSIANLSLRTTNLVPDNLIDVSKSIFSFIAPSSM